MATRDSGRGNEACPWESPGPGPGHETETCKKDNNDSESDTKCTSDNFRSGNSITNRGERYSIKVFLCNSYKAFYVKV